MLSVFDPMHEIVDNLNEQCPDQLIVSGSFVDELLREAEAGRLRIRPRAVLSLAEPFDPVTARGLQDLWACTVFDAWAATETGPLGGSTGFGSDLVLHDDWLIIEPVDEKGQRVSAGQLAEKLYVTPFYRFVLPLIRYELTDQIAIDPSPPDGPGFTRASHVAGRLDDLFVYPGGLIVHPHLVRSVLAEEPAVRAYHVEQTANGLMVRLVAEGNPEMRPLASRIEARLQGLGLAEPAVRMERVEALGREPGRAKVRRFIPLASTREQP
jgi:phenylacetate-coenzyme A ligase PaaK-like adenylate-forming protein